MLTTFPAKYRFDPLFIVHLSQIWVLGRRIVFHPYIIANFISAKSRCKDSNLLVFVPYRKIDQISKSANQESDTESSE